MFSLKAKLGKRTVTCTCVFSSICIKLVNIKNNFQHILYPLIIKNEGKKLFKKWIVARRPQSNYQEK